MRLGGKGPEEAGGVPRDRGQWEGGPKRLAKKVIREWTEEGCWPNPRFR